MRRMSGSLISRIVSGLSHAETSWKEGCARSVSASSGVFSRAHRGRLFLSGSLGLIPGSGNHRMVACMSTPWSRNHRRLSQRFLGVRLEIRVWACHQAMVPRSDLRLGSAPFKIKSLAVDMRLACARGVCPLGPGRSTSVPTRIKALIAFLKSRRTASSMAVSRTPAIPGRLWLTPSPARYSIVSAFRFPNMRSGLRSGSPENHSGSRIAPRSIRFFAVGISSAGHCRRTSPRSSRLLGSPRWSSHVWICAFVAIRTSGICTGGMGGPFSWRSRVLVVSLFSSIDHCPVAFPVWQVCGLAALRPAGNFQDLILVSTLNAERLVYPCGCRLLRSGGPVRAGSGWLMVIFGFWCVKFFGFCIDCGLRPDEAAERRYLGIHQICQLFARQVHFGDLELCARKGIKNPCAFQIRG